MQSRFTVLTKLGPAVLVAVFAWQVYQSAAKPIGSAEAYTYDRFVRPTARQTLAQELPNPDLLYTLLEKRSVGLFHVSPLSVRLPGLLFLIVYLWSTWQLARLFPPVLLAGLVPLGWDLFATAQGTGTALALDLLAVLLCVRYFQQHEPHRHHCLNLAGAFVGLSIVARQEFALPAGILLLSILLVQRKWTVWADRVLIPAIAVAWIFLVLPLSHAHAAADGTPPLSLSQATDLQAVLRVLRTTAGTTPIRIAASPAVEPVLNFYRAQYRATTWERADRNLATGDFDYYLLVSADSRYLEQRHLIVLYRDANFVLAHRGHAAM